MPQCQWKTSIKIDFTDQTIGLYSKNDAITHALLKQQKLKKTTKFQKSPQMRSYASSWHASCI